MHRISGLFNKNVGLIINELDILLEMGIPAIKTSDFIKKLLDLKIRKSHEISYLISKNIENN